MKGITPADLRRPTDYKARYERAEHQRMRLADRVKDLELERDGLKYRLQEAEAKLRRKDALATDKQSRLPLAQGSGTPSVS